MLTVSVTPHFKSAQIHWISTRHPIKRKENQHQRQHNQQTLNHEHFNTLSPSATTAAATNRAPTPPPPSAGSTVPCRFCFHILFSINTADPDLMAEAAMLWARARMHKIDVTLSEHEKGVDIRSVDVCEINKGEIYMRTTLDLVRLSA